MSRQELRKKDPSPPVFTQRDTVGRLKEALRHPVTSHMHGEQLSRQLAAAKRARRARAVRARAARRRNRQG